MGEGDFFAVRDPDNSRTDITFETASNQRDSKAKQAVGAHP